MQLNVIQYTVDTILNSFAKILLQQNKVSGLLIALGIGLNSLAMLLGGIIAILTSLAIAELLLYKTNAIKNGEYGYNAALVGIATFYFLPMNIFSLWLLMVASALATLLLHLMRTKAPDIPPLTAPFVCATWLMLLSAHFMMIDSSNIVSTSSPLSTQLTAYPTINALLTMLRGISQILLQDYWLCGLLFVLGLLICSAKAAAWAVFGSAVGLFLAHLFNFPVENTLLGNYSFNASLVAIAVFTQLTSRVMHQQKQKQQLIKLSLIVLAIIITVVLTRAFEYSLLASLTAPFIISNWLLLAGLSVTNYGL